jgi:hypothetical protein
MGFVERRALLLVAIAALIASHPICNLLFRCGCSLFFATQHCNLHDSVGPRCPWCVAPWRFAVSIAVGLAGAAGGIALARRGGRRPLRTVGFALVGLALGVIASGAATALSSGYPRLLFFELR